VHLSPRHAEILALLATAPEGLGAEALGEALYGPGHPLTSVRSEISRLRRLLGPALATRPYRLTADVEADLVELLEHARAGRLATALALREGALLPGSAAPGIARLREELDDLLGETDAGRGVA
jgi:hypothetical protein